MSLRKLLNKTKYLDYCDLELMKRAYRFAEKAHKGQKRLSGDPYITHPVEVACFLADLKLDGVTLSSALVHDVKEDTNLALGDIEKEFSAPLQKNKKYSVSFTSEGKVCFNNKTGKKVAQLVDGVTKLGEIRYYGEKGEIENFRKMILAMVGDMRVVLIKLADRLHNVKTLAYLPRGKQKRIARNTLEIYAPLADRLGMGEMKGQLEDFSFKYFLPKEYNWTKEIAEEKFRQREQYVENVKKILLQKLKKSGITPLVVEGRAKHLYSLYKKLQKYDNDINKIYDLVAIRIIVDSVACCYETLGVIHADYKPLLGHIKDYIAMPKPNGYMSLHTTVFCTEGKIIEIQIKTQKMHQEAEWGIAAHWHYAEKKESIPISKEKIAWVKQLALWQKKLASSEEFAESLKIDIFQDRIFAFTPRGDVKDLPEGATAIDFAYAIHSELGHKCIGAKANGKIIPLDDKLKNGDVVEILTSKIPQGPRRDWLTFIKTNFARNKIKNWFKKIDREKNLQSGKEILNSELKKLCRKTISQIEKERITKMLNTLPYNTLEDVLVACGEGSLLANQIIKKLFSASELLPQKTEIKKRTPAYIKKSRRIKGYTKVEVTGHDGVVVKNALCCRPHKGDKILGYVTRGQGITIHKKNCPNITSVKNKKRIVGVQWKKIKKISLVNIRIVAWDRVGLFRDIGNAMSILGINLTDLHTKTSPDKIITLNVTLEVSNIDQITKAFRKIEEIKDIINIERV